MIRAVKTARTYPRKCGEQKEPQFVQKPETWFIPHQGNLEGSVANFSAV